MNNKIVRYGMEIDLSKEGHTGCVRCISEGKDRSHDNLMCYGLDSDGEHLGAHCFSCGYTIPSAKWLRENGDDFEDEEEWEDLVGLEYNPEIHKKLVEQTGTDPKGYRGIKKEYSEFYGLRYTYNPDQKVAETYYPTTKELRRAGYKKRIDPKDFSQPIGEVGKDCDLFGQIRFKSPSRTVIIAAGEHDVVAARQILSEFKDKKYPVPDIVCGTTGESSVYKQIQSQYHYLNQYSKIIVCMDNDEAGRAAFEKIVKVLPRNKIYTMQMTLKDPNEYIDKGEEKAFVSAYYGAKLYTPAGVYASTELYQAALDCLDSKVITLPPFMSTAAKMLGGGLVEQEITMILAKTSIGKTLVVNEITKHIITNHPEHTLGVLSLEATYKKYSRNLLSSFLHIPLHRKSPEEKQEILSKNQDKIESFYTRQDGTPKFFVCDDRGANIEGVKEKVLEMILYYGITILVCDPYSDLLSNLTLAEQEDLATWLKKIMKEYNITPIVISHVRKGSNNSNDHITEDDAMGSSFLAKGAGITIALERDKQHEDPIERNRTYCYILKNREFSETGAAGSFYFDIQSATLHDYESYFSGAKIENK